MNFIKMFKKLFTPKEANQMLPLVKRIVHNILEHGQNIKRILASHPSPEIPGECYDLQEEIEVLMRELEELGCYFKDWNFEIGLVDFPAFVDGEEVFLCWRSDEGQVLWYHSIEDGFPGRRPIPAEWLLDESDL